MFTTTVKAITIQNPTHVSVVSTEETNLDLFNWKHMLSLFDSIHMVVKDHGLLIILMNVLERPIFFVCVYGIMKILVLIILINVLEPHILFVCDYSVRKILVESYSRCF